MNETLVCSVVDNLPFPLPQTMSGDWNGDWFTADPSTYATLFASLNEENVPQEITTPQVTHIQGEYPARYQYEYGRNFGGPQISQMTTRAGTSTSVTEYNANQGMPQQLPPSIFSSPPVAPSAPVNRGQMSTDRSQPSTPAMAAFPTILPSQKLQSNPPTTSTSQPFQQAKRGYSDAAPLRSPKRRPSDIPAPPQGPQGLPETAGDASLSDEERLLLHLKSTQNLPWKAIALEFESHFNRPFQVPALQMRYKRLRERMRPWTSDDIAALEAAHEYWESNKYEIIANKMLDFGVSERWPARYCERKWEGLHPERGETAEQATGPVMPGRFDTDMMNHSVEWPIPSPEAIGSGPTSPLVGLAQQSTTLPRNPLLLDYGARQDRDPT